MKKITIVLINNNSDLNINDDIELIETSNDHIKEVIESANGEYIAFICNDDLVSDDYIDILYKKTFEDFDTCYINNYVDYNFPRKIKRNDSSEFLDTLKPYFGEYIWSFIYKTSLLKKIIRYNEDGFDKKIDRLIKKRTSIEKIIYYHNSNSCDNNLFNIPYVDYKSVEYYKNVIYVRENLTSKFNGVITWCMNIGKLFGKKYDITILYDEIYSETYDKLDEYFNLVYRDKGINYFCDRYLCTYLSYDIPRNIFYTEESSTFVIGIMQEDDILYPDLYDRYIGVSKTCRDSIKFAFETNIKPEYIYNPIKIEKNKIKKHLKLVSTLRSEKDKGLDKLKQIKEILDEEEIPYTWNVFTDINEGTNNSGFIFRNSVYDVLPYVNDSDYLVLLSNSESFSYSVAEALSLDTKVVVTPLEVFEELGVNDSNGIIIPFEYFEKKNKEKLRKKVIEMYNKSSVKVKNSFKIDNKDFEKLLKK